MVASRKCATLAMLRTIWNVVELSKPVCRSQHDTGCRVWFTWLHPTLI